MFPSDQISKFTNIVSLVFNTVKNHKLFNNLHNPKSKRNAGLETTFHRKRSLTAMRCFPMVWNARIFNISFICELHCFLGRGGMWFCDFVIVCSWSTFTQSWAITLKPFDHYLKYLLFKTFKLDLMIHFMYFKRVVSKLMINGKSIVFPCFIKVAMILYLI